MLGNDKMEEYREINSFWISRLCNYHPGAVGGYCFDLHKNGCYSLKEFDQVLFANGGHFGNVPKKIFKCAGIEIREGRHSWGAIFGKKYFVIKIGERVF